MATEVVLCRATRWRTSLRGSVIGRAICSDRFLRKKINSLMLRKAPPRRALITPIPHKLKRSRLKTKKSRSSSEPSRKN